LTFEGVIRVQEVGEHLVLHSSGTVHHDDGGFGAFQSQEIIHDEHVATFRAHDMELYDEVNGWSSGSSGTSRSSTGSSGRTCPPAR
jgi:hypothetical protein